jgi:glucan biosynthesis protein C
LLLYVFHQPVIVALSYYVVQWQADVTVKMIVIFFGSLAMTLSIVELLVRRVAPLRALFGIKASQRS